MKVEDLIIASVDDHVVEPPTMFDQHLSAQHQAIKPRVAKDETGADFWLFEGRRAGNIGLNAVVGRMREEYGCEPISFDQMRKGAWDLDARIEDMNANGVLASLNFPSVVTFDGSLFHRFQDKNSALILLQAYNDWHIDEWCGRYPGRNIPNALVPYWDMDATVKELARVAKKGCHAISFSDNPALRGQPSIHDDHWAPFWKAVVDNDIVINIHIGSGAAAPHASMASPIDAWITTMPISIVNSAADWLWLRALQHYPLKIALSEGGIGWIPYFLERADFTHEHHHAWTYSDFGGKKPSDVFREHFMTCFIDDAFGLKNLDAIGEDNVSYECDYPHSDSVWPDSADYLLKTVAGLTDRQIHKVTHENALALYKFDAFGMMGGRDKCTAGALRRLANHVDTRPVSFGGPAPLAPGEERRPVTSGDITKMFEAVALADGQLQAEALGAGRVNAYSIGGAAAAGRRRYEGPRVPTESLTSNKIGQRLGARGRQTRERFLEGARGLLATTSPIDLTAAAISKAARSSPATFYVYFDDVREVLLGLSTTASARVEALFPRADALLRDDVLDADVATMVAAVDAAWDRNAPILLYRNLEADRGDARFDALRTSQAMPMIERIVAAIERRRPDGVDEETAIAEAGVLVAAIERIAVRTHRAAADGIASARLTEALVRFVAAAIRG